LGATLALAEASLAMATLCQATSEHSLLQQVWGRKVAEVLKVLSECLCTDWIAGLA
jgi:hypothetical protein